MASRSSGQTAPATSSVLSKPNVAASPNNTRNGTSYFFKRFAVYTKLRFRNEGPSPSRASDYADKPHCRLPAKCYGRGWGSTS